MIRALLIFILFSLAIPLQATSQKTVNLYGWAYVFPPEMLTQFQKETGIKVNLDVYDTPEIMETKLFTGNSGYDVVMVTVWPYLPRQLEAKIYQPLQTSLIPNKKEVDPLLLKKMEKADPQNVFALPFIWGTNGFAYNVKMIEKRDPKAPVNSLAMLFDPQVVAKFADCGVMLIDSPIDVFPPALAYLKKDPNSEGPEDLKDATKLLAQIRPYVKKFKANPATENLTSENYCLVQGFSSELTLAQKLGKKMGLDIRYVIPEEGGSLWVDALAIPKDAPHPQEANMLINFLLRPDVIAQVTNEMTTANSVPSSSKFIEKDIRENQLIFPSKKTLEKLYIDKVHSPHYERLRLREWTRVKIGR
ncbi:MAG: extracellular solute-binding protein [Alphaproteobacteria bacterium]|nr:extracellular solute-binding protein [Alphaproteobacteria bacterium]